MRLFARLNGTLATYEGMSQETVVTMLTEQNLTPEFINEETYNDELKILQALLDAQKLTQK
jgi:hypothetical protein